MSYLLLGWPLLMQSTKGTCIIDWQIAIPGTTLYSKVCDICFSCSLCMLSKSLDLLFKFSYPKRKSPRLWFVCLCDWSAHVPCVVRTGKQHGQSFTLQQWRVMSTHSLPPLPGTSGSWLSHSSRGSRKGPSLLLHYRTVRLPVSIEKKNECMCSKTSMLKWA